MHKSLVEEDTMDKLKSMDVKVWTYTLNQPNEAIRVLKLGVDGIITDNANLVGVISFIKGLRNSIQPQSPALWGHRTQLV